MLHPATNTANQKIMVHTFHFHLYKHKRGSHFAQEHPTDWVVLAPAGIVTFPVVAWWKEYSQASIEEGYGSLIACSWNTSLKKM